MLLVVYSQSNHTPTHTPTHTHPSLHAHPSYTNISTHAHSLRIVTYLFLLIPSYSPPLHLALSNSPSTNVFISPLPLYRGHFLKWFFSHILWHSLSLSRPSELLNGDLKLEYSGKLNCLAIIHVFL